MENVKKRGILVVSFGTSFTYAREMTIDAIEKEIAQSFPDYRIYRAWTSKMIIAKLKKRDNIHVDTVKEAMERMAAEGITDVVVQPTHVMNGIENDLMKEDALSFRDDFHSITFGTPILTSEEDHKALTEIIGDEFAALDDSTALVLMGHGSTHYANSVYAALDYRFKDMGHPNIFLGTVEAYPGLDSLLKQVKAKGFSKVLLTPFMLVAGDHAHNDMAGDSPDSWNMQFSQAGFQVSTLIKGLGEYPRVRSLIISHVKEALCKE